jgi:CO/xanthine dehydrogenase Mo-binding subunit
MRSTVPERNEQLIKNGDSAAALQAGARRLNATYEWPAQSHGSMGPSCAVADAKDDQLTVWSASQGTHRARQVIAVRSTCRRPRFASSISTAPVVTA